MMHQEIAHPTINQATHFHTLGAALRVAKQLGGVLLRCAHGHSGQHYCVADPTTVEHLEDLGYARLNQFSPEKTEAA